MAETHIHATTTTTTKTTTNTIQLPPDGEKDLLKFSDNVDANKEETTTTTKTTLIVKIPSEIETMLFEMPLKGLDVFTPNTTKHRVIFSFEELDAKSFERVVTSSQELIITR